LQLCAKDGQEYSNVQAPEDVTGRIFYELQSGNMFWFNRFIEFLYWVLLAFPSKLHDEVLLILDLEPSVIQIEMLIGGRTWISK
jgi:hypothetical protein